MNVMLVVAASAVAGTMPSPTAPGPQPMRAWTYWAVDTLGMRVCYEGSRNDTSQGQVMSGDAGPTAVRRAIEELDAASYPIRFASRSVSGREVVYVTAERGADGTWADVEPLLDTRIDVAEGTRTINDALSAWSAALSEASGQPIVDVRWLSGGALTSAAGTDVAARDLLIRILDDAGGGFYGPNLVWDLVWVDSLQGWALGFRRVWALEKLDQDSRAAEPRQPVP